MSKIKVTQTRSLSGQKATMRRTIASLGLGKINRCRVHEDTPVIRGMVQKVWHMVKVEEE